MCTFYLFFNFLLFNAAIVYANTRCLIVFDFRKQEVYHQRSLNRTTSYNCHLSISNHCKIAIIIDCKGKRSKLLFMIGILLCHRLVHQRERERARCVLRAESADLSVLSFQLAIISCFYFHWKRYLRPMFIKL